MRSRLPALALAAGLFVAAGCGARSAGRPGTEAALRRQLAAVQAERDEQSHVIAELRNRVFILEDRVDTQRVAISRQLPVVRLEPARAGARASEAPTEDPAAEAEEVEAGPRPLLKLYERGGSGYAGPPRAPVRSMPSSSMGPQDALPVVSMDGIPAPGAAGISAGTAEPAPAAGAAESASSDDASSDAIAAYEAGFALFRARRFDEALASFAAFVQRYPRHSYADNALYWRGECYYARRDFRAALAEFEAVTMRYPDSNKAPDAMLKAALSRAELGDVARARAMLYRLAEQFPRSDAARIARERVARLGPGTGEVRP